MTYIYLPTTATNDSLFTFFKTNIAIVVFETLLDQIANKTEQPILDAFTTS